jgi:hypothetical protein
MKRLAWIALVSLPVCAHAEDMKPGLWQYNMQLSMQGVPAGMPGMGAQSFQRCVTAKEVADRSAYLRSDPKSQCTMSDFKQQGKDFSYNVACKGQMAMSGKVTGSSSAESLSVSMDLAMNPAPAPGMGALKQTITARRLGECKS